MIPKGRRCWSLRTWPNERRRVVAFASVVSPKALLIASALCFLVFLLAVRRDPSGFSQIMGLAWPLLLIAAGVVWVVDRRKRGGQNT